MNYEDTLKQANESLTAIIKLGTNNSLMITTLMSTSNGKQQSTYLQ